MNETQSVVVRGFGLNSYASQFTPYYLLLSLKSLLYIVVSGHCNHLYKSPVVHIICSKCQSKYTFLTHR